MTNIELNPNEFDPYYGRYIYKLSDQVELRKGFKDGQHNVLDFFKTIIDDKWLFRYEPGKWNIKEIFQHLIDTERIFMYRCFRIARGDKTELAGFDQNIYMEPSKASDKNINDLLEEFTFTRDSSIALLNSLSDHDLKRIGNANGGAMSARAAAFTIIGHDVWHMDVIKEKYL